MESQIYLDEYSPAKLCGICLLIAFVIGLAQSGGIGGGQIVTPLLIVLFNLETSSAIRYNYIVMFFSGIGNFIKNSREQFENGPLIDYDLVLVMLPLMMTFSQFGVIFNKILPKIVTDVLLMFLMTRMLNMVWGKYRRAVDKENKLKEN